MIFNNLKRAFFLAVIMLLLLPIHVFAISENDRSAILRNTPFYDPTATYTICYNGDFSGGENGEIIFNYLVSKGFTHEQAAGFVGNFYVETVGTFDPTIENFNGSGARGIAQWEGGRLDRLLEFAGAQGKDPWVLATQLEFVWFELTGEPSVSGVDGGYESNAYTRINSTETVEIAAFAVSKFYERNADSFQNYPYDEPFQPGYEEYFGTRILRSEQAYAQYSPGASDPGDISQSNCGGLGVSLDGFVFPIKSSQASISWCSGSFGNCHGTAWNGTYHAYDIFAGGAGAEVVAVRNGTIRRFFPDYRCSVPQLSFWLEGDDGNSYFYQHLDANVRMISDNEQVAAGQSLGVLGPAAYVGGTCNDSSPHLHFAASSISSVVGEDMSMYRGCGFSDCPNMDKLIDIASVLKAAYDALPQ